MAQNFTVGVILVLALSYVVWYLLPGSVRQYLAKVHPALGRGKACGSCSSCKGCGGLAKSEPKNHSGSEGQALRFHGQKSGSKKGS